MAAHKKYHTIFAQHLPLAAAEYCLELWVDHKFTFKITNSRKSKLGDYRYDPRNGQHTITVNGDLSKYAFLITYLHEVAHLLVKKQNHKKRPMPHGAEWQEAFRQVAAPCLRSEVFPDGVLKAFRRYLVKPKASTSADPNLVRALHPYAPQRAGAVGQLIADLPVGSAFMYNGRTYKKGNKRRTRFLCKEQKTGKHYLFASTAQVQNLES